MYRCFLILAVWPALRVVKLFDTVPGLLEGRHADCWTVTVAASGIEMGLAQAQWKALPTAQREARRQVAMTRLHEARPDFFLDTVAELPAVLDAIEARLAAGGWPCD
jgi:phosphonoacetaldehyde hydrolase